MFKSVQENKTIIFNTLDKAITMTGSPEEKQLFLEETLEKEINKNPLAYIAQIDNTTIKESKAKLNANAATILEKSRLPQELRSFMSPELLTAITLTVLTNLFQKIRSETPQISRTALIRAISDHFIRQLSFSQQKEIYEKKKEIKEQTKLEASAQKKEKEYANNNEKAAITLAAKIVEVLEDSNVCKFTIETKTTVSGSSRNTKYLYLSDEWAAMAAKITSKNTLLPMLCHPKDWKLRTENNNNKVERILAGINLEEGGYLTSSLLKYQKTALLKKSTAIYHVYHSKKTRDNINYIQKTPFRINKDILKKVKISKLLIPEYKLNKDLVSVPRNIYCHAGTKFNPKWAEVYDASLNFVAEIDYGIEIAERLQYLNLYFTIRHDGRGRIYPIAYPVSPIAPNHIRSLLTTSEDYYFSKETHKKEWEALILKLTKDLLGSNSKKSVQLFKKNPLRAFENIVSPEGLVNDFSLYSLKEIFMSQGGQTSQLIGLDVTASGLQIMGLITRCKKALEMTNVFDRDEEEDVDIYYAIQRRVIKKHPIVDSLPRTVYKGIIMRLSYGESNYSRKDFLYNHFRATKNKTFEQNKAKGVLLFAIAKTYETAIYEEFPAFKTFIDSVSKVVETRIKLNLGINLKVSDIFASNQYYNVDKATTYSFKTLDGRPKRVTMFVPKKVDPSNYNRFEAKPNNQKTKRATLPNLVHHIDSLLVHLVIEQFRNKNKPLFTIHDAFYVRLIDMSFLKDTYFKALKEIHEKELWLSFLTTNLIDLTNPQYHHWTTQQKRLAENLNENLVSRNKKVRNKHHVKI